MSLTEQLKSKLARVKALAEAAQAEGREFTDAEVDEINRLAPEIEGLKAQIQRAEGTRAKVAALAAIDPSTGLPAGGSNGHRKAATSPWTKATMDALAAIPGLGFKAILAAPVSTTPQFVVPLPDVPTSLLDLVPRAPYGAATVDYLRQTVRMQNAAAVADNATKPTSVYTFEEVNDRLRVVAHLSEAFPIRYLADYNALANILETEMLSGLQHEIERLIVEGDEAGANTEEWNGILNTTGTIAVPFNTDILTTCRSARTALKGVTPTGWAFNPADLEAIDLMRDDSGASAGTGGFLVNSAAAETIFGPYPRVPSEAVPQGTAILANWRTAVNLLVREDASTLVGTQAGELFDKNQMKVRCEGRFLGQIVSPPSIAVVDLTAA